MLINRRQKFPEPPPPASHNNNNILQNNNSDCVVVSVATSSNNDPFSGKTVIFGDSSSQHQDFTDFSNSNINNNNLHDNGKSKSNGVIANLLTSIIAPSGSSSNNNNNNLNSNDLNTNSNFILPTVFRRLSVLVSLLLLQSLSQFVLEAFEDVVQANIVIPLFLTMLVGAGGNAGNQSAVRAIAMLARGELNATTKLRQILPFVKRECVLGFICALVLSVIGALRVFVHQFMKKQHQHHQHQHPSSSGDDGSSGGGGEDANSPATIAAAAVTAVASAVAKGGDSDLVAASIGATVLAISLSLFLIVALSCVIGVMLPFVFLRFGMSPEHAAPAIQVIMDVLGVFLTCVVCSIMLPSSPHKT